MRLAAQRMNLIGIHPWNYGYCGASRSPSGSACPHADAGCDRRRGPAQAQQASQPGFDPRQTEKRFDAMQSEQAAAARSGAADAAGWPAGRSRADTRPLFVLRNVSLTGAASNSARRNRKGLSTLSREKGLPGRPRGDRRRDQRSLSRGRLSPEPRHRAAAGHPGRPGPRPGDRRQHHRGGVERRRRRAIRRAATARPRAGRTALAPADAGAAAAADQRPAGRAHHRYRARGDRRRQAAVSASSSS